MIERPGQNARHPETEHGSRELERQVDLIARMRTSYVSRFLGPSLTEEPEEPDIHENARKPQRMVATRRHVRSLIIQVDRPLVPECPIDLYEHNGKENADNRRPHEKVVPV